MTLRFFLAGCLEVAGFLLAVFLVADSLAVLLVEDSLASPSALA